MTPSAGQVVRGGTEGVVAQKSVLRAGEQHQLRVRPCLALQYPHDRILGVPDHDPHARRMRPPHSTAARAV
jgi:hypothetical protein